MDENVEIEKSVVLFGLGPHAKRIHLEYLRKKKVDFLLVVDLEEKEFEICNLLGNMGICYEFFGVDSKYRNARKFDELTEKSLISCINSHDIHDAIISTEPRAHFIYIDLCLKNNINIVCDKPLTSPIMNNRKDGSVQIVEDYKELIKLYQNSEKPMFEIMTQRRTHLGYKMVCDIVQSVVKEYNVPITKIYIHHCDGMWNMPGECIFRENHPYKYGYGKIMHSGYHFFDLMNYFMSINSNNGFEYSDYDLHVMDYRPYDFFQYYNKEFYNSINFQGNEILFDKVDVYKNFGEFDVSTMFSFKNSDGAIITNCIVDMMQSGYSKRAWFELPEDTYKGNGRIRHEEFEITVGPLLNVKVLSFQAKEIREGSIEDIEVGGLDHFDIQIYRNTKLIGGKEYELIRPEKVKCGDMYLGHNENARFLFLDKFFNGKSSATLEEQETTIEIVSKVYDKLAERFLPEPTIAVECVSKNQRDEILCSDMLKNNEGLEEAIERICNNQINRNISNPEFLGYRIDIIDANPLIVYQYVI